MTTDLKWHVKSLHHMFYCCQSFNQSLSNWDASSVEEFHGMFGGALAFNQPLVTWKVKNATNMRQMFMKAEAFNQPLHEYDWDMSKVWNMESFLKKARSYSYDPQLLMTAWGLTEDRLWTDDIHLLGTTEREALVERLQRDRLVNVCGMFDDIGFKTTV